MTLEQKLTAFFEGRHAGAISKKLRNEKRGSAKEEEKKRQERAELAVKTAKLEASRKEFEKYGKSDLHKKKKKR